MKEVVRNEVVLTCERGLEDQLSILEQRNEMTVGGLEVFMKLAGIHPERATTNRLI